MLLHEQQHYPRAGERASGDPGDFRAQERLFLARTARVLTRDSTGATGRRRRQAGANRNPARAEDSMTSTDATASTQVPDVGTIDMKLEVVTVPVSDVDRSKRFYQSLGWRLDADIVRGDAFRDRYRHHLELHVDGPHVGHLRRGGRVCAGHAVLRAGWVTVSTSLPPAPALRARGVPGQYPGRPRQEKSLLRAKITRIA